MAILPDSIPLIILFDENATQLEPHFEEIREIWI